MTIERRLAKIETSLTPTQRVLVWLDEAHAFEDLTSYVGSLLDQGPEAMPISRLAHEASSATRTALRGKPVAVVDGAVRKAVRETVFRFELVMRINTVGHDTIEREALIHAVLASQLALLVSDDRTDGRSDQVYLGRMAQCRDLTAGRVSELLAAQEARTLAEQRYLDGHAALFPDDVREWADQMRLAQELAVLAERLAELDGVGAAAEPDSDAVSARVSQLLADLIEPARSTALDKLDEGRQAIVIATAWLRPKLAGDREISASAESPTTIG